MHGVRAAFINSGMLLHCLWCCALQPIPVQGTLMCVFALVVFFFPPFSAVKSARGWLKWKATKRGKILQKGDMHVIGKRGLLACLQTLVQQPSLSPLAGWSSWFMTYFEKGWKGTIYLQRVAQGTISTCWIWILNSHSVFNRRLAFKSHCTIDSFFAFYF